MSEANQAVHRQLWAPWRLDYIVTTAASETEGCFLCRYGDSDSDATNYVVARDGHSIVVLNRFPYNNGHLLIAPVAHKASLQDLDDDELLSCMRQLQSMTRALATILSPDGYNIGLNLGKAAGAGLPGHLHWHVVPRWQGDTNFMPVIGDTKVIPQSLETLSQQIREVLSQPAPTRD